jgi:hypothetical protein
MALGIFLAAAGLAVFIADRRDRARRLARVDAAHALLILNLRRMEREAVARVEGRFESEEEAVDRLLGSLR